MALRKLTILHEKTMSPTKFPLSIPALKGLTTIEFNKKVTFFVGENGSGKSTLLESIAFQCGFNIAGGTNNNLYDVNSAVSVLGEYIRLSWFPKIHRGFFFRAESFYLFSSYLDQLAKEDPDFKYQGYGGKSLHKQSHGEAFLSLFTNRFGDMGIYLLDEPEAALSPSRQLALLRVIKQLEEKGSQFIIATHSPILLGYPDAEILSFDTTPISKIKYEDTDHYQIMKGFLTRRELYLKELFEND